MPTNPLPDSIRPVAVDALTDAHRSRAWDSGTKSLLREEFSRLARWFARDGVAHRPPSLDAESSEPGSLMGLAISGGGIRSATFALGALQLLARRDLLKRFDYLSTVSGGGYIGSALTWWLHHGASKPGPEPPPGLGPDSFPFGSDNPADAGRGIATDRQRQRLRFLRQHGNYLTPGEGLTFVSALAIAVRGILLSVLFWLLFLVWVMSALLKLPDLLDQFGLGDGLLNGWRDWLRIRCDWSGLSQLLDWAISGTDGRASTLPAVFELALWFSAGVIALLLVGCVVYSVLTVALTYLGVTKRAIYWSRRRQERWLPLVYLLLVVPLTFGLTAVIGEGVTEAGPLGSGGVVAGAVAGIWTYARSGRWKQGKIPLPLIAGAGSLLLMFGALVVSYRLSILVLQQPVQWRWILAVSSVGYAVFVDLNHVSVHRLYRDRLMEAFLPDPIDPRGPLAPPAYGANAAPLSQFWDPEQPQGPYHLINTNVVLVGARDRTRQIRGGDNFLLSPLMAGSNATGWTSTRRFCGNNLSLASAMAISGAAANPNAGSGGMGLTRNRAVSMLMTVLGISLGYWVAHPLRWDQHVRPNHLVPGLCVPTLSFRLPLSWTSFKKSLGDLCAFGTRGFNESAPFLQLSDGGHFENLAVYELIRRRMRLILLLDGSCDPDYSFEDFQILIRRIEADFGAQIRFDPGNHPEALMPSDDAGYPPNSKVAKRGHLVGTIHYCDGSRGMLVYLKSAMIDALSLKTKGYKGSHPDFPHETTADQFFDEDQFEAYRELGYQLAERMVDTAQCPPGAPAAVGLHNLMRAVE